MNSFLINVSKGTIGEQFCRLRNIASFLLNKENIKLEGDGLILKKTKNSAKVKHQLKDLIRKYVWIFLIKERTQDKFIMQIVSL